MLTRESCPLSVFLAFSVLTHHSGQKKKLILVVREVTVYFIDGQGQLTALQNWIFRVALKTVHCNAHAEEKKVTVRPRKALLCAPGRQGRRQHLP